MHLAAAALLSAAGLLAAPLAAAVPGVPEPGPGGTLPLGWVGSFNDLFGTGLNNGDDYRTAGAFAGGMLGNWVISGEAAMLTHRASNTRSDQAVLYAGRAWQPERPHLGWHASGWVGLGLEVDQDLGGQTVQNDVHATFGVPQVDFTYDPQRSVQPAIAGALALGWLGETSPLDLPLVTGWWGVQVVASSSIPLEGTALYELGPRVVLLGHEGCFWVGTRWRFADGQPPTPTLAETLAHEEGFWIDSGTQATPFNSRFGAWGWSLRGGLNPDKGIATGAIGLLVRPGGSTGDRTTDVQHEISVYGGGGLGVQLRWLPWPYQDLRQSSMWFDWRFGTEPGSRLAWGYGPDGMPEDADLRHDQWTAGWEEAVKSPPWGGIRYLAFAQAGLGARTEGVVVERTGYRLIDRATAPVAVGSTGVRMQFGEVASLGLSLDGWLPWWQENVQSGPTSVTLLEPGWAAGLHAAMHLAW